jgi:hypothetical protein
MKQRAILLPVLILSVVAAGYFAYRWRQAESRRIETVRWTHFVMDSLGTTLSPPGPPVGAEGKDSVYWQWVATTAQLQSRRWQEAVRHWVELRSTLLDDADIADLKRQGLENPPRQLRESLVAHTELIPFRGVLGGTMYIVPDEKIVLLNPPYVFAEFEDGHIGGTMLVEYTVLPGPQIQWKRLWAARE